MSRSVEEIAIAILKLSRNTLAVHMRFMDVAISRLKWTEITPETAEFGPLATRGNGILYDPGALCRMYVSDKAAPPRAYLHLLLHCVFRHFFVGASIIHPLWDIACDIAVEGVINSLGFDCVATAKAAGQQAQIQRLLPKVNGLLTAEKLYAHFRTNPPSESEMRKLTELFSPDNHRIWYGSDEKPGQGKNRDKNQNKDQGEGQGDGRNRNPDDSQNQNPNDAQNEGRDQNRGDGALSPQEAQALQDDWQAIAERIQTDLETFSKDRGDAAGCMMQNLRSVNREKYDYTTFLKQFAVMGEEMRLSPEEFDYIFYTYGMKLFPDRRMPLIEPLEYRDVKRIREFVIAIDTSGSVEGDQVQAFLQKTYNILQSTESFFSKINLHIIQCDAQVQQDVKITSREEFDDYLASARILGLGGTDFRPVFSYVDHMIAKKEFTNLKGLIYFTDGYGTFPERMPGYKTAFVFVEEGYEIPEVPVWAIRLVLTGEEMRELADEQCEI